MHIEPYHRNPRNKEEGKIDKHLHQKRMNEFEARLHNAELEMQKLHIVVDKLVGRMYNKEIEEWPL